MVGLNEGKWASTCGPNENTPTTMFHIGGGVLQFMCSSF